MGVWIETTPVRIEVNRSIVTPCVGVWIETINDYLDTKEKEVTPCVGVWIETNITGEIITPTPGHTLRGCVD